MCRRDADSDIDSVARTRGNHAVSSGLKFRILREFLQLGYSVLLSDIDIVIIIIIIYFTCRTHLIIIFIVLLVVCLESQTHGTKQFSVRSFSTPHILGMTGSILQKQTLDQEIHDQELIGKKKQKKKRESDENNSNNN